MADRKPDIERLGLSDGVQKTEEESRQREPSIESTKALRGGAESIEETIDATQDIDHRSKPAESLELDADARFGRYQLLRRLGAGGMGQVYVAEDVDLRRDVALKLPLKASQTDDETQQRFLREARSAASLDHKSICPVYDFGEIEGQPYLAMALIDGESLAERISDSDPMSVFESVVLIQKLAQALDYAHRQGVIHRDIKPQNVVIDGRGNPVLLDFGLARLNQEMDESLTQSGVVLGTPAYLSPEQADGQSRAVGPASDIYSLGCMLYELIAGRRPFVGSATEVMGMHLFVEPERPSIHNSSIDPLLDELCLKMLAKQASQRYASMSEISDLLEQWIAGKQELALTSATSERLGWWIPVSLFLAALAMLYFAWFFSLPTIRDTVDWLISLAMAGPCILASIVLFAISGWWTLRNLRLRRMSRASRSDKPR